MKWREYYLTPWAHQYLVLLVDVSWFHSTTMLQREGQVTYLSEIFARDIKNLIRQAKSNIKAGFICFFFCLKKSLVLNYTIRKRSP